MNKRAITWLLAALLALSSGTAVNVTGARERGAGAAIVWIAKARSEQQVALRSRFVPDSPSRVKLEYQSRAKTRQFAASLYQRPPPSLR